MNYGEFNSTGEPTVGQIVWICDYRHNDFLERPIRHVKPTQAVVVSNDDLPKRKTVYYAETHFRPIGKKGKPLKQIIAPYDNTGYRSYEGESLQIFHDKEDCIEKYMELCNIVKDGIESERELMNARFDEMINNINDTITDYK